MPLTKVQDYLLPEDPADVVALLGKYQDNAMILAGGTFVHGLIARGLLTTVTALIDIQRLGLAYVTPDDTCVRIGAMTTFTALQAGLSKQDTALFGAVLDAMTYPPAQIRNAATIGGSLASSCPFFDLPVACLALDGVVRAEGPNGGREIGLEAFFPSLFENALADNEFMTELRLPVPAGKSASAFIKLETNANDLAILNAAAAVNLDDRGRCRDARIFVGGGVGEAPVRAVSAEAVVNNRAPSGELCTKAGEAARSDVDPLSDHRASAAYRTAMTRVLVERALKKVVERLS
jgi:CO/xanthine dehydrogenase FAD-binding subunit